MKKFSSTAKKSFRRSSARAQRIKRGIIILAVSVLVLVVLGQVSGTAASFIGMPIKSAQQWVIEWGSVIPAYFRDRSALVDEQEVLTDELAALRAASSSVARLLHENRELRELLSAKTEDRIAAGIVMRPHYIPYDTFLIDRGSHDGVTERAVVYAPGDTVIGVVSKTYTQSALVSLVSTPGMTSTAYIYGPDIYTEATGQGGGVLRVGVPQGVEIAVGDVVVLPSVSPGVFGTISHVESSASSPEQYGYLTSPVSLQELRLVSVSKEAMPSIQFEDAQSVVEETRRDLLRVDVPTDILVSTSTATSTSTISPDRSTSE